MLFAISSGAASLQIAPPLVAELPLIVLLAICNEPLLPIPPPRPGPLSGSQHRIAANSAVADRQRRACAVGRNATAKTGLRRARVTPAGKVSADRAASDYRIARVVNSAPHSRQLSCRLSCCW